VQRPRRLEEGEVGEGPAHVLCNQRGSASLARRVGGRWRVRTRETKAKELVGNPKGVPYGHRPYPAPHPRGQAGTAQLQRVLVIAPR
jgi:hypothetical protein